MSFTAALAPAGGWAGALSGSLGIAAWRVPVVILSAVGVYLVFLLLVRLFGPRVLTAWSTFDAVVIIMFGAVAGRVIIGHPPTLLAGLIGLTTLMCMEAVFGEMRRMLSTRNLVTAAPVVIVAHGRPLHEIMRRQHITDADLASALRRRGIIRLDMVLCVIVEPDGALSVVPEGESVDPTLLDGVVGAELVTDEKP